MKPFFGPSRKLAAKRLKEGGPRIVDPRERWFVRGVDLVLRGVSLPLGLRPRSFPKTSLDSVQKVLALRLDRLGDLVMTLPALAELRRLTPDAEIELAVGSWNEDLARGLPFVDRVRVVDAPWAAWGRGAGWKAAAQAMRAPVAPDLAIDFQGDIRALLLMAVSGARARAGYADTGGGYLLTHVGRWDEKTSWYRQNTELLKELFPHAAFPDRIEPLNFLLPEDREMGRRLIQKAGLAGKRRPWIGIHPSAGRAIKQWRMGNFASLIDRLVEVTSGTVVVTGAPSDRGLVERLRSLTRSETASLISDTAVRPFSAALEQIDLFVTGDTGPMHLAHAVGVPNLALFGPSDPVRYGPEGSAPHRLIVRHELFCSPCNMIRNPPPECLEPESPECLALLSVDQVLREALRLLESRRGP